MFVHTTCNIRTSVLVIQVPSNMLTYSQLLAPLDSFLDDKYKSKYIDKKFSNIFGKVPDARTHAGYKIALRMTRGPTNSCINFHCDGVYATSTSQIPLNSTSEYEGGALYFFVSNQLLKVPRIPGTLVQHPPNVLHGVTSVVHGTRKSLFIVDKSNGLGEKGVVSLTADHVKAFLLRGSSSANGKKRAGEEPTQSANKKVREEDTSSDKDDRKKPPEELMNIKKEVIVKKEEYTADTDDEDEKKPSGDDTTSQVKAEVSVKKEEYTADIDEEGEKKLPGVKADEVKTDDKRPAVPRKVEHIPQAESPTMSWKSLWEQMRKFGWKYDTSHNHYLHPSATKISQKYKGIHFFTSEKAMKQYAIKHLGWRGDGGSYDSIRGLTYAAQVILCIAVSLDQALGQTAHISMSILKKYCIEAAHYQVLDEYSLGNISDLVEILMEKQLLVSSNRGQLGDLGFLNPNRGQFNIRNTNAKVKVKVQLDDVEIALEKSLLNGEGFYKSLVDYVRREVR